MLRKFHIDEFPTDRVFILLDKEFHKEIFDYIEINYGFGRLNAKFFKNKLNFHNYKRWKYRTKKQGNEIPQFIPLWFITKIPKISQNYHSIEQIERNILAYKGPSTSSIIWNPNLPLIEDGRMLKILAHILGDGHAGGGFGSGLPNGKTHSEYRNYNGELLNQFERDIQVFGKVHTSISYSHYHVIFPNLISYFLEHFYKIKTDSHISKIPNCLFRLDKEIIAKFIRAFADDEAHVYDDHIDFYSTNKKLLLGIMKLFKIKFPKIKILNIKRNKTKMKHHYDKYYFYVLAESREDYFKLIGFDHKEKNKDLIFNIARNKLKRNYKRGLTKRLIINFLSKENLSAKQLSRKLILSHGHILSYINKLKQDNKIKIIDKGHFNENIWRAV